MPEFVRDDIPEHQCFRMTPRGRFGPDSVPEDRDVTATGRGKSNSAPVKTGIELFEAAVDAEDIIGLRYGRLPPVQPQELYGGFLKHK